MLTTISPANQPLPIACRVTIAGQQFGPGSLVTIDVPTAVCRTWSRLPKPEPHREQCRECKRIGYHATFCSELDWVDRSNRL